MRFLSVCSGIEAASAAWHPRWNAAGFAEVADFPSAVLATHYPDVPNFGDFTTIEAADVGTIDLLVGGTPCQSFSIAGLRGGLDDDRGNLALEFCRLADRTGPRWIIWENGPGVLSMDGGRAFAAILGGLAECGYGLAYRVLDAQYVRVDGFARAVPQRRRRVFVVGYLGDWRRAAAVLFEPSRMRRDTSPRREAGQIAAPTIAARTQGGGGLGTDFDCDGDPNGETWVAHALTATSGATEDGTGRGTPIVPISFDCKSGANTGFAIGDIPGALRGEGHGGGHQAIAIQGRAVSENPEAGPDVAGVRDDGASYTLEARTTPQAVAFDMRGREGGSQFEGPHETANVRAASGGSSRSYVAFADHWAVRRLTPTECERLMGFPDGYTAITYRGKPAADGPRYKALGNSMAVNVMRWIGQRIEKCETAMKGARREVC